MANKRIPKKVKQEIIDYIKVLKADRLPIRRVYLFGSFAKGKQNAWSDIDLCVVSPKFKDSFTATQYLWLKRRKDTGLVIEPVGFNLSDFSNKYDSLVNEIKTTGIPISFS